jgi:hypothetical protein
VHVCSANRAAYKKQSKGCDEYDPRHDLPKLFAAHPRPADAPDVREEHAKQDAHPERVIVVLNKAKFEMRSDIDIKRGGTPHH